MNPESEVESFRRHFESIGTEARAVGEKKYLKSRYHFLGATVPQTRAAAKSWAKEHPELTRKELLDLVRLLWEPEVFELANLGSELLILHPQLLRAGDMKLVARLIQKSDTWALVDKLAADVAGPLVARHAAAREELSRWNRHENFWIRRASLLALLRELRAGRGDLELFESLAVPLFWEKEFFIRKAIGWVLRDTAKVDPLPVAAFLDQHAEEMALLSVQVASKPLPEIEASAFVGRCKAANAARRRARD